MPGGQALGSAARGNLTAILAILAAMACFTVNDVFLKLASSSLPLGELIFIRNAVATAFVVAIMAASTGFAAPREMPYGLVGLRLVGEAVATLLYLGALVLMPIADVTAIHQLTPLAVTAAAALFLREPVGWRRWLAAAVGLGGVILIIRPGASAFTPAAILALGAVAFVVLRDLATRQIPAAVPTLLITAASSAAVLFSSLALLPFETWRWPAAGDILLLFAAGLFLTGGYIFIIVGMRSGEIAVVSPFRYSVILFALFAGFAVWGEVLDALSLVGVGIVVGAGLYTFHREHIRRRDRSAIEAKPASG